MRILVFLAAWAAWNLAAWGQAPVVGAGGVVNHFSYALPGMPNGGIAQGSIFDIFGTNMGPAALVQANGFPLPAQLGGTSVQVTVAGTTTDVLLFYVSAGQIAGLLPSRTPVGTGTLVVTANGQRSAATPITVTARSIGILSLAQNGQGAAVMQLSGSGGEVALNSATNSARGGQVGVFYGTGLGAVPFDESRGAPLLNLDAAAQAFVDGKPAKILYQGRVPGLAGLDQFNVEIPEGVSGCAVTVYFQTGTVISNLTTISVGAGGSCPDPMVSGGGGGLTGILKVAGLQMVRVQQKVPLGGTSLELTTDSAAAAFSATDLSKIPVTAPQRSPMAMVGGCLVGPIVNTTPTGDGGAAAISYLNAGASMNLRGPNGVRQMERSATGYGAILGMTPIPGAPPTLPPPYSSPGVYTMDNGAGGPDVPAFTASITLPDPAFAWTNADQSLVIQRAQGMEVTWSGGDATGWVDIAGASRLPRSATQPVQAGALFSCRVPANLGRFRIPAAVLQFLPATVVSGGVPSGTVSVGNTMTPVKVPLEGYYQAELIYGASVVRSVEFR